MFAYLNILLSPAADMLVVPHSDSGFCEAHIRPMAVIDIRKDSPASVAGPYTIHRASREAVLRYEQRMAKRDAQRELSSDGTEEVRGRIQDLAA